MFPVTTYLQKLRILLGVYPKLLYWDHLLYINDLPNVSNEFSFHLFAVDTNIFFESSNLDTLQTTVNREMGKLVNWLNSNCLALNV